MGLFLLFLLATLFGGVVSAISLLPLLIPPLRRLGQDRRNIRIRKNILFGLLAFVPVYMIYAILWSYVAYDEAAHPLCECSEDPNYVSPYEAQQHGNALKREFFFRAVAYPIYTDCFSDQRNVCQIADRTQHKLAPDFGPTWIWFVYAGLCATVLNVGLCNALTISHTEETHEPTQHLIP
jgi:hypothetical protein